MSQHSVAEMRFRESFERLKGGVPQILPVGTEVSQNNVAKEAGKCPSALRKERFPELVNEIQDYIDSIAPAKKSNISLDKVLRLRQEVVQLTNEKAEILKRQQLETSRVLTLLIELKDVKSQLHELQKKMQTTVTPFRRP